MKQPLPQNHSHPVWLRRHWIEIAILVGGLVAMNLIFVAEAFRATDTVNPTSAGQLGDFVGGYVGTFFALVSVLLLTSTMRGQRRSSQQLNFETKYFELLRLHRDNVAELEVQGIAGRKLFVVLLREYRSTLEVVIHIAKKHNQQLSQRQLAHIAYYCIFFGTGPNSSRMLLNSLFEFDRPFVEDIVNELDKDETKDQVQREKKLAYRPFEGHQSRLGHYYRHLYQAIKYVDMQENDIDKYEYTKTIRAQLSNHEQALLLLNSLSPMGRNWWKYNFIQNYRLVQNLPRNFFDPNNEIDIGAMFEKGYFEWEEVESET